MIWLWVGLGAALGAPARYLIDRLVQTRYAGSFPWGTLLVNAVGSFVLGIVTGAAQALAPAVGAVVGIGFCGALTTYSTFSYETLRLLETKVATFAAANVMVALAGGFGAAALGLTLGGWLF
ncbi:MAG: fluoride efflux transporter CrcB [Actinomycetota bacterium]|nr:fluoride efflux transporter CrcB [Actinomycetota bacterium]